MTRPPDLSVRKHTGPVRSRVPIYVNLLPPCNNACPAGEDIQGWLGYAQSGQFKEAWLHLVQNNPFPATMGRICYHPCESQCNRLELDSSVNIHAVERFLGDLALEKNWQFPDIKATSGKRILVIGAGPSGLSAAYHLACLGHEVEIRDAGPVAGGMMHFGIPSYRLPRDILAGETGRIENMGVKITLNHKVEDLLAAKQEGNFNAIFVAVGAHISKKVDIPARDAGSILNAINFLKDVDAGNPPKLGRRVAIYGGGNTAMDAARVAKRLGVSEAMIIYRRDRDHMPAHQFEADEAISEDIKIHWLRSIKDIDSSNIQVEVMRIGEDGRPQPTGEIETIEADSLILALGQDTDTEFLRGVPDINFKNDGTVIVSSEMMTGHAGIFAGGDMVPSERTATIAIGHGKKAARNINAWLKDTQYKKPESHPIVDFKKLNIWYRSKAPQSKQEQLEALERGDSFEEVVAGLSKPEALFEAKRCFSCGNCFECDGCYGACPDNAIVKLGKGKGYRYDYDLCTGCAVCYEQCPCHAIEMMNGLDGPPDQNNANEKILK